MSAKAIAAILLTLAIAAASAAAPSLKIVEEPTLLVSPTNPSAKATLWLLNDTSATVPLTLSIGPFTIDATHQIVPAEATLDVHGATEIAAGKQVAIDVTVKDLFPGAGASAPIRNQGSTIGTVRVAAFGFKVTPDGWKDGTPYPIRVGKDAGGRLTLVNADAIPYKVKWTLSATGAKDVVKSIDLPPLTSVSIPMTLDDSWFANASSIGALFREPDLDAVLSYAVDPPSPRWPAQFIKTKLTRAYWSDIWRPWFAYGALFLLLLAGGLCSLVLTNWVPNRTLRIDVQSRLDAIAAPIRNFTASLDSRVRVGLGVERLRIAAALKTRARWSADYPALAKSCADDTTRLETVVTLVQRIESVYRDAYAIPIAFVPTLLIAATDFAADAERMLSNVANCDLDAARAAIGNAETKLADSKALTDDFRTSLSARVADLVAQLPALANSPFMKEALSKLGGIESYISAANAVPNGITPANYCAVDAAASKIALLADLAPKLDTRTPRDAKWQQETKERLFACLTANNLSQWRRARRRALELDEGITLDDLKKAITDGNFTISVTPNDPNVGETAQYRIEWFDRQFGSYTIRNEVDCRWDFGDGLSETGWWVAHYLAKKGKYPVNVTFSAAGAKIKAPERTKTIAAVQPSRGHGYTEVQLVRLGIALLIAILGLLSGAADQIAKLDLVPGLIAVFMLGFSADQIKNVITKGSPS